MRHTPAGPGAILMATELPFAYLIDVALVREPTNALSAVGVAVVFLGVACATAARAAPKADTAPLRAALTPYAVHVPIVGIGVVTLGRFHYQPRPRRGCGAISGQHTGLHSKHVEPLGLG